MGAHVSNGLRAPNKERPPSPEYDRRCQNQFDPALGSALTPVDKVHRRGQAHDNNRQRQGPPETSPELFQFRILVFIKMRELDFQRRTAKDRKSVGQGTMESVSVDIVGRSISKIQKK